MRNPFIVAAICLALGWLLPLQAQQRTSAIEGTVRDQSGSVVADALIVARHLATNHARSVRSDAHGMYRLASLDLGEYEVTAEKAGFKVSKHQEVRLEVDREAVVNYRLEVGAITENIVVVGESRQIEATPSAMTSIIDEADIRQLPLNGRDYLQLASLQAGAPIIRAQSRSQDVGFGLQISISGSRPSQNNLSLDGVSMTTYNGSTPASINGVNLGVDAIEEFSIQSSTYGAQYGRASGGIINAVTKSGTNAFHGTAFFFHRNDNLDARNFFDAEQPPEFRRNQFGASIGGPIRRNRTFFFYDYEGLRQERGNTVINTTLSAEARQGNLSSGLVSVHPNMGRFLDFYPLPNGPILGDTGLFSFQSNQIADQDFQTARVDHHLGDQDKIFVRYTGDIAASQNNTDFLLGVRSNQSRNHSAAFEETHIFTPNVLNTLRLGFLRTNTVAGNTQSLDPSTDDPSLAFQPGSPVMGTVEVSGLTQLPGGSGALNPDKLRYNSYQLSDDVSWVHGAHSVRFGGRLERIQLNSDTQSSPYGEFRFRSIEQFLTNKPDRFRGQFPGSDTVRGYRQWVPALYVQDTWRIMPRLTLDLGLRWEWATVPTEVNGKTANLDTIRSTEMRIGDPLFNNPSIGFVAPRVGLAFDVFGTGKTMVRSGYGIYPELLLTPYILYSGARNPPFFVRGDTRDLSVGDFPNKAFAALSNGGEPDLRIERVDRNPSQPYVQQWNFNIEQLLGSDSVLRIGYVGSHGLNQSSIVVDANLAEPTTLADGRLFFPEDGEKLNPAFGRIRDRNFNAHSFYHALQASFRQRFANGFQGQLSYAFAKSIDDSSNFFANSESANSALLPINGDPKFNRGLSGHDIRHSLTGSGTWDIPAPKFNSWGLLSGWQLGGIMTYNSGLPFSAWLAYDAARTQTGQSGETINQRPDLEPGGGDLVTGDPLSWVNRSALQRPQPGFLGNLGRNTITGPNFINTDFSVTKRVKVRQLGDSAAIDFRAEFFNLFNRTNFDLPEAERMEAFDEDVQREDFARITSARQSREIQLAIKLTF